MPIRALMLALLVCVCACVCVSMNTSAHPQNTNNGVKQLRFCREVRERFVCIEVKCLIKDERAPNDVDVVRLVGSQEHTPLHVQS